MGGIVRGITGDEDGDDKQEDELTVTEQEDMIQPE